MGDACQDKFAFVLQKILNCLLCFYQQMFSLGFGPVVVHLVGFGVGGLGKVFGLIKVFCNTLPILK
jgi:hypothetical protein